MNCEKIRNLFEEVWAGNLDAASRALLESHLSQCDACREEWESLSDLWSRLSNIPDAAPGPAVRPRFYSMLHSFEREMEKTGTKILHNSRANGWFSGNFALKPLLQFGVASVLLIAGFLGGYFLKAGRNGYEEIANLREEVHEMRQMVTISLLKQQSASERLKGVSWSSQVTQPDSEFLSVLMQTLNYDPNVDVRLAAIDALSRFASNRAVREGLVQSLPRQASPLVQISLIDLLVQLQERQSVDALKRIINDTEQNQQVRQRAEWGLQKLI